MNNEMYPFDHNGCCDCDNYCPTCYDKDIMMLKIAVHALDEKYLRLDMQVHANSEDISNIKSNYVLTTTFVDYVNETQKTIEDIYSKLENTLPTRPEFDPRRFYQLSLVSNSTNTGYELVWKDIVIAEDYLVLDDEGNYVDFNVLDKDNNYEKFYANINEETFYARIS